MNSIYCIFLLSIYLSATHSSLYVKQEDYVRPSLTFRKSLNSYKLYHNPTFLEDTEKVLLNDIRRQYGDVESISGGDSKKRLNYDGLTFMQEDARSKDFIQSSISKNTNSQEKKFVSKAKGPSSKIKNADDFLYKANNRLKDISKMKTSIKSPVLEDHNYYRRQQTERLFNVLNKRLRREDGGEADNKTTKAANNTNNDDKNNKKKNANTTNEEYDSDFHSESSDKLMRHDWKAEWLEHWTKKKLETLNATHPQLEISMLSKRPWGVPCGDPHQHDVPWGSCVLRAECEAEYRIYRGDFFCGNTYICCQLSQTNYDLYQNEDFSFMDKSISTSIEDIERLAYNNKHIKNKEEYKERQKRKRAKIRAKRKEEIAKKIKMITDEMKRILNNLEANETRVNKKKTRMMKKFVKVLKQQFKDDRVSVIEMRDEMVKKIDIELMHQINLIMAVNRDFAQNKTFRDIIVNGTVTKEGANLLAITYPHLKPYLPFMRSKPDIKFTLKRNKPQRRNMEVHRKPIPDSRREALPIAIYNNPIYFEYDIEYGILYY